MDRSPVRRLASSRRKLDGIGLRARSQAGVEAGEALLEPGFQPGEGQGQLAADGIQGLAAQQAEDDLGLGCGVPAAGWG